MALAPMLTALHNGMALARASGFVSAARLHCWFGGGGVCLQTNIAINMSLTMNYEL